MVRKCQPYTVKFTSLKHVGVSQKGVPYGFVRVGIAPEDSFDKEETEFVDLTLFTLFDMLKNQNIIIDEYTTKDYTGKDGVTRQNIEVTRAHLGTEVKPEGECPW